MFGWLWSLKGCREELKDLHNAYRTLKEENVSLRKTIDSLYDEISRLNARLSQAGEVTQTGVVDPEKELAQARILAYDVMARMAFNCMNAYPSRVMASQGNHLACSMELNDLRNGVSSRMEGI